MGVIGTLSVYYTRGYSSSFCRRQIPRGFWSDFKSILMALASGIPLGAPCYKEPVSVPHINGLTESVAISTFYTASTNSSIPDLPYVYNNHG